VTGKLTDDEYEAFVEIAEGEPLLHERARTPGVDHQHVSCRELPPLKFAALRAERGLDDGAVD